MNTVLLNGFDLSFVDHTEEKRWDLNLLNTRRETLLYHDDLLHNEKIVRLQKETTI